MQLLAEALSMEFMQRALIAGTLIAVTCALLGGFLVLRRWSMIGDGLAHVSFAAAALGILLGAAPLQFSIPLVTIASLVILKLSKSGMDGDAAIGLLSSFAVAFGVLAASLSKGFNVDLFSYLFGSILSIQQSEVILSAVLSAAVTAVVLFLYGELFSLTFDEEFARSNGLKTERYSKLLVMLTAVTVVLGIRVVGTMLISALIVIPAVTALQLRTGFKMMLILSAVFAALSVVIGILTAFLADLPAGAAIVMVNFAFFTAAYLSKYFRRK